jgi:hypothetical protein
MGLAGPVLGSSHCAFDCASVLAESTVRSHNSLAHSASLFSISQAVAVTYDSYDAEY